MSDLAGTMEVRSKALEGAHMQIKTWSMATVDVPTATPAKPEPAVQLVSEISSTSYFRH